MNPSTLAIIIILDKVLISKEVAIARVMSKRYAIKMMENSTALIMFFFSDDFVWVRIWWIVFFYWLGSVFFPSRMYVGEQKENSIIRIEKFFLHVN